MRVVVCSGRMVAAVVRKILRKRDMIVGGRMDG